MADAEPTLPPSAVPTPIDPADHLGLVVTIARRYTPRGADVLDSEPFGDGMLGLVRAAAALSALGPDRPDESEDVAAFLAVSIRNAIRSGWRRRHGKSDLAILPFTDAGADGGRDGHGLEIVDGRRQTGPEDRETVAALLGRLDERERRLVERCVMWGWTHEEAVHAEPAPITPERVRQIVAEAVAVMREAAERGWPGARTRVRARRREEQRDAERERARELRRVFETKETSDGRAHAGATGGDPEGMQCR